MTAPAQDVSQETFAITEAEERFLRAWKDGVELAGEALFGCQARTPREACHWHQLTPKLDVIRRALPNRSQADAVFIAAMASFYNAEEGQRLLRKAGCEAFGNLANFLDRHQRAILAVLMIEYQGW